MLHGRDYDENGYLFMVTRNGTVKRTEKAAFRNIRTSGLRVLTLDEGDELISVRETTGEMNILIATHDGMAICFRETDVRPMGRTAVGVRGIKLREGDYVIGAVRANPGKTLLTITENGYGKRTPIEEYIRTGGEPQHRGGLGLKGYQITDKTGKAAGVKAVGEDDDIMIISDDGTIIRMAAADVNIYSRTAQGVRVMRVSPQSKVIALARVEKEMDEEEAAAEGPAEP
jgi:DNA gyrase subunit A